ncbi:hypothetical protein [Microbacterium hibisci]|uniref:hypothetical protein n=1 Tax=Microbacterium hibisci TaxID=2036000 RepID=UPI0019426332|nr:hypothetical protein [Microbacterium hibisci]
MDDATIRRYLSESRLIVLDIVHGGGARDGDDVARVWAERRTALTSAHMRRLPRVAGQILWQLASMQWIERSDGEWAVTGRGLHARDLASALV